MSWICYICLTEYNRTERPLLFCDKCNDGKICYQCIAQHPEESFHQCGICRQIMFIEEKKHNTISYSTQLPQLLSLYKIIFCCLPLFFFMFLNVYFYIGYYRYITKDNIVKQYGIHCILSIFIFYMSNLMYFYLLHYLEPPRINEYRTHFLRLRAYSSIMFHVFLFIFYKITDYLFHDIILIYEYIIFESLFCICYSICLCRLRYRNRVHEENVRLIIQA